MMKFVEIISAVLVPENGRIVVTKEITNDDDTVELNGHSFPVDSLEWLAVTYDTDNKDLLVDILLYEPFVKLESMAEPSAVDIGQRNVQAIAGAKTRFKKDNRTRSEKLIGFKNRMTQLGVDRKYIDAADEEPYEVIKRHSLMDEEVIQVKREYIKKQRQPTTQPPGMSRAEQMRKILNPVRDPTLEERNNIPIKEHRITEPLSNDPITLIDGKREKK